MRRKYKNILINQAGVVDGFITIEYTLLLPILLMLYTFLVYMGLYQYNQCILQTNMYILGTEGTRLIKEDPQNRINKLQEIEGQLYYDKYLLADDMKTVYLVRGNQLEIVGSGKMENPLVIFGMGEESWSLNAVCESDAVDPVATLRLCKAAYCILQETLLEEERKDDS